MNILVSYASRHGSTRSVAEQIAARLTWQGLAARARSLNSSPGASGYDAFVLGSAIHDTAWLPDAVAFARRHPSALSARPRVAVQYGAAGADGGVLVPERGAGAVTDRRVRMLIHSIEYGLFAGAFHREHTSMFGHLLFRGTGGVCGDYRDWAQIDAWADRIARSLRAEVPLGRSRRDRSGAAPCRPGSPGGRSR